MVADDLSDRFSEVDKSLTDLQQRVQNTAADAHQDVTHLLELALTSLVSVVKTVHADYKERVVLNADQKKILSKMRESFEVVDTAAKTHSKDFGTLYEEVRILRRSAIDSLGGDVHSNLSSIQERMQEAGDEHDRLRRQHERIQRGQEQAQYEHTERSTVDNIFDSFKVPVGQQPDLDAEGKTELGQARQQLEDAQRRWVVLAGDRKQAQDLLDQLQRKDQDAAQLLLKVTQIRAAMEQIDAKAIELRRGASDVVEKVSEASTTHLQFSKSDFAFRLVVMVARATFDFAVKDGLISIMAALLTVWKVNETNQMPNSLKEAYGEVQAKVDRLQQGSEDDVWNKAVKTM